MPSMNIRELNYLVLSSIREMLQTDAVKTAALFNIPPAAAQRLRAVSDADLRNLVSTVSTPLVTVPLNESWFSALTTGDASRTIDWSAMMRYRAAVIGGGEYVS